MYQSFTHLHRVITVSVASFAAGSVILLHFLQIDLNTDLIRPNPNRLRRTSCGIDVQNSITFDTVEDAHEEQEVRSIRMKAMRSPLRAFRN